MWAKMDTSTPVRNDYPVTCVIDNDLPSIQKNVADEFSRNLSEYSSSVARISSARNEEGESVGPPLNKSAELFSCSPIRSKNIPYALLPLLDTPDHKWSDSILTPYKFDSENGTSPKILTQIFPDVKDSENHLSTHTTAPSQKFDHVESVSEFTFNQYSNSFDDFRKDTVVRSPIIQANQKSKRWSNNRCTKKLFDVSEENCSVAMKDEIPYQNLSDMTLCAIEQICQSNEILYNNSSESKLHAKNTNRNSDDCDINTLKNSPDKFESYLTTFFNDNLRYKRRFVYPYDAIKKPVGPILIDQVIESVLPLEKCEHVSIKKSQLTPRSMVSFNELNNSLDDAHPSIVVPLEIDSSTLVTVIRQYRNVYHSLKSFFSTCRVDFIRFKDDFNSCLPISSQLTLFCKKRELISRLDEELCVLKTRIRIRVLEQFMNIFRSRIHLAYNGFGPRKNNLGVSIPSSYRRKRTTSRKSSMTRLKRNTTSVADAEQLKTEVFTLPPESVAVAEALLADMQDSDFEIDVGLEQSQKIFNDFENREILGQTTNIEPVLRSEFTLSRSNCPSDFRTVQKIDGNDEGNYFPQNGLFSDECVIDADKSSSKKMTPIFRGFSTALGKRIDVRSDQMARGQKMLESVTKTLASENLDTNFPQEMLMPPSKLVEADEAKLIDSESSGSCMDVEVDGKLFSRGILHSISTDSIQSIRVSTCLEEPHNFKRALQITSPEIKQSKFKRLKSQVQAVSTPIPIEKLEDMPELPEKFSTRVLGECHNGHLFAERVSRSASPEICVPVEQRKLSRSLLTNDEIKLNESLRSESRNTLDDSLWIAIENSSFLEKDLYKNGISNNLEVPIIGSEGTNIESKFSETIVGSNKATQRGSKVSESALEIDENFYHDTDDELFSELSESIFLSKICPSANNTVNETAINDLQNIDISRITVGFKTASGHRVDVSHADLKKAQNIFEGVDESLLKETPPSPSSHKIVETSKISSSSRLELPHKGEARTTSSTPASSITTAGSELNVLNIVPQKDQKWLKDVNDQLVEDIFLRPISPEISSNLGTQQRLSELVPTDHRKSESSKMSVSFRTAAGHKLNVQNLKRAHKFIQDVEADLIKETLSRPTSPEIISHFKPISARPKPCHRGHIKNEEEEKKRALNPSVSFSTASGNVMNVSKIALEKARKFFDEEASQCIVSPEITMKSKFCVNSRLKSRLAFENDEISADLAIETLPRVTSREIGLKRRKKLNTRPKVLQFTRMKSGEEVETETSKVSTSSGRISGNEFSLPATTQKDVEKFCEKTVDEVTDVNTPSTTQVKVPEFVSNRHWKGAGETSKISISFSTAAGNKLSAPKAYLEKARDIFKDVDRDLVAESFQCPILPEDGLVSEPSSTLKVFAYNEESRDPEKSILCGSTSESKLNVLVDTPKNTQKYLPQTDEDRIQELDQRSASPEFGSSSKSTRPKLREIALSNAVSGSQRGDWKMPISFKTVNGNEITVSETALKKVRKLFQDVDREDSCEISKLSFDSSELLKIPGIESSESKQLTENCDQILNKTNDIYGMSFLSRDGSSEINEKRIDVKSGRLSLVSHPKDGEQKLDEFAFGRRIRDLPNVATGFSLQNNDSKLVSSNTNESSQISVSHRRSSVCNSTLPMDLPRAVSPVVETRRSYQLKKRQKRRSQTTSNSVPLSLIYNGKGNESTLSSKSSPEDILRKIKDTFSQRSNKRKEPVVGITSPVSKRSKESETVIPTLSTSCKQTDIWNKPKADCTPRCGSYLRNQKNTKRMTLRQAVNSARPGCHKAQELILLGLKPAVISVNAQNAGQFVFSSEFLNSENVNHLYGDECTVLPNENNEVCFENLARGFLASPGVDPRLISEEWIRNHYRWIVWKLSALEKSYPHLFGNNYLTLTNVLHQLKYRYDREIDRCERSVLKRILEFDDSPSRPIILCVATVRPVSGALNEFELELTDGWYSVWSQLDLEMCKLVQKRRVVVGTKLLIANAELVGAREGRDPLEIDNSVRLKIATNSTRLARWDALLGFYASSCLPVVRDLKSILPYGGTTYPILSVVARVYPLLYMEKKVGGYSEVYNEKVEFRKAANYEKDRLYCWEQLASVITREVERETNIDDGDDYVKMEMGSDENNALLPNPRIFNREKLNSLIKGRIENKLPDRFRQPRVVLRLLKVRVVNDCNDRYKSMLTSAIVTIWNPSEEVVSLLKEGKLYIVHNLSANNIRNRELMLTSNRTTRYEQQSTLPRSTCHQRRYTVIGELKRDYISLFDEIDTVGIVIGHEVKNSNQQIIYLADLNQNILAMKFRFDLKDYGFEEVLKKKSFVAAINLHWKGEIIVSSNIPCTFVTEYTTFTQKSRLQHLQSRLDELESHFKFKCLDTFVQECGKKLERVGQSHFPTATSTPVKLISSEDADVKCNKDVSNQSESLIDVSGNLEKNLRSKDTQMRIDRLRQYGEPPPLSPITMSSVSNIRPRAVRLSIQTGSFRSRNCSRSNKSV